MRSKGTAEIVLYKAKTYVDGTHPVLLRVSINGKRWHKIIQKDFKCMPDQWNNQKREFKSNVSDYFKLNKTLSSKKAKAKNLLYQLCEERDYYTIEDYKRLWEQRNKDLELFKYFDEIIERLEKTGKIGNKLVYEDAKNSFYEYLGKKETNMTDIQLKTINKYVEHCQGEGHKLNTISVRLRTLRALFNKARKEEGLTHYPFMNFDFGRLKSETAKRAIPINDVLKIINLDIDHFHPWYDAKNYFVFSYLTYGLNFADMAKLEPNNIKKVNGLDILEYYRSKGGQLYEIPLDDKCKEIIRYYRNQNPKGKYIFPILNEKIHKTPEQIKTRIKTALKKYNDALEKITKHLGIDAHVTSYVSRHSFASVLKKKNIPIDQISEMLGHTDVRTTQIYLKSLEYEEKLRISKELL